MSIIAAKDWQVASVFLGFRSTRMLAGKGRSVSVPVLAHHARSSLRGRWGRVVLLGGINHQIKRKDNPSGPEKQSVAQSLPFFPHLYYRTTAFLCWEGSHNLLLLLCARPEKTDRASASATGHTFNVKLSIALLLCINTMLELNMLIESAQGIHRFCMTYLKFMNLLLNS